MSKPVSPELRLRMAWAHIILKMDQHDVAALFSVNPGRVAEAVKGVRSAIYSVGEDDHLLEDGVLRMSPSGNSGYLQTFKEMDDESPFQ